MAPVPVCSLLLFLVQLLLGRERAAAFPGVGALPFHISWLCWEDTPGNFVFLNQSRGKKSHSPYRRDSCTNDRDILMRKTLTEIPFVC
uniref:Putative secreted protein n=1 Tax=Ixodes ricinus TaxID=34613 RepID=A0A6B0UAZ1_IXORI